MKLLSRYNRVNVIATIIVLLISAVFYYFFIKAALVHQLDKNLKVEEKEITGYIRENNLLPERMPYLNFFLRIYARQVICLSKADQ